MRKLLIVFSFLFLTGCSVNLNDVNYSEEIEFELLENNSAIVTITITTDPNINVQFKDTSVKAVSGINGVYIFEKIISNIFNEEDEDSDKDDQFILELKGSFIGAWYQPRRGFVIKSELEKPHLEFKLLEPENFITTKSSIVFKGTGSSLLDIRASFLEESLAVNMLNGEFSFNVNNLVEGENTIVLSANEPFKKQILRKYFIIRELTEEEKKFEEKKIKEKAEKATKRAYKNESETTDSRLLIKHGTRFVGDKIHYKGKVIQAGVNYSGSEWYIIGTTNKGYGYYDDNVWVSYDGETDIIEGKIVEFWGEVKGYYSYESVAGWDISIPKIEAVYLQWWN